MNNSVERQYTPFSLIKQVVQEPLLHFLLLGFCLFLAYSVLNPNSTDTRSDRIVVDRTTLLTYMQYRAKAFDAARAQQQLDAMPSEQRQQLIDDYIREETLYREAKALQLDKNDSVARQRLIQQMRYLMQSVITATIELTDDELQRYLKEHAERYAEPAKTTFTHVFISTATRSLDEAQQLAQQQLKLLNQQKTLFHQALGFGDRFLYHRNYVQKDAEFIASHFGESLQAAVVGLPASENQWHGPYQSPYGYHLVLVAQQTPEYHPHFEEVKGRVAQDLLQERRQQQVDQAITQMIEAYEVDVSVDLSAKRKAGDA